MSLSQQGQQTVLTSEKPHLVGLEVDPLSTDIVIYHLEVSILSRVPQCFQSYGASCMQEHEAFSGYFFRKAEP